MSDVNVRRSIAAAAVLAAAPVLSSCGVNFGAQTDQVYQPGTGVDDRSGSVDVINALIVSGDDGSGTVVAGLVNNDEQNPDTLKDVAGAGDDGSVAVQVAGPTRIDAGGLLNLAKDGGITVSGKQVKPGTFVTITFSFDRGAAVTLDLPVVSNAVTGDYDEVPVPSTGS
jgi:hypothetical protein